LQSAEAGLESDQAGARSAEDVVRLNEKGIACDVFGLQSDAADFASDEVGGGPNELGVDSVAFRCLSDGSGFRSDASGIRLKKVRGRTETARVPVGHVRVPVLGFTITTYRVFLALRNRNFPKEIGLFRVSGGPDHGCS
jgi:hypothetical protein